MYSCFKLRAVVVAAAILLRVASSSSLFAADQLSVEQRSVLELIDQKSAVSCVELTQQLAAWRRQIEQIATQVAEVVDGDEIEQEEALPNATSVPFDIALRIETILESSPQLEQLLKCRERIKEIARSAATVGAALNFNADDFDDADEESLRQDIQLASKAAAAKELLVFYNEELFKRVELLGTPAEHVRNLLEDEIGKKYLDTPYQIGDVRFRFERQVYSKSPFAKDANISVILEYQPGLSLTASGLYFEYREGSPPLARLEKVRPADNAIQALAKLGFKQLGNLIPAELGLPIKVKNVRFSDFAAQGTTAKPGSLLFDIEASGLCENVLPGLRVEAKGLSIDTLGNVTPGSGGLRGDISTEVPIGSTGLVCQGYSIELRPQSKDDSVKIGTVIAPAGSRGQALKLKSTLSFGFPVKTVRIDGDLQAQNLSMGNFNGEISTEAIKGILVVPGQGNDTAKPLINGKFDVVLDRDGFFGKGHQVQLFGASRIEMEILLKFDGHSTFTAQECNGFLGFKAVAAVSASGDPGFTNLDMKSVLTARMDLLALEADVVVQVDASSRRAPEERVEVKASAVGKDITFYMSDLNTDIPRKVQEQLLVSLGDILDNISKAAARLERDVSDTLAKAEKDTREELTRWGKQVEQSVWKQASLLKLDAGNFGPSVSAALGKIADQGANVIGGATSGLGGAASGLSDVFGGGKRNLRTRQTTKTAAAAPDELHAFANVLNTQHKSRTDGSTSKPNIEYRAIGTQKWSAQFDVLFKDADVISVGQHDIVIPFSVRASSFRFEQINSSPGTQQAASDVKGGAVYFQNIRESKERAKAFIVTPPFADCSHLSGLTVARDVLQDLIERYLPDVEIQGPIKRYERILEIQNACDDAFAVRVRVYGRKRVDRSFQWTWSPEEKDASMHSFRVVVPAQKTVPLLFGVNERPLQGSKALVGASSESGKHWSRSESEEAWLVDLQPDGERYYRSDHVETRTLTIRPDDVTAPTLVRVPSLKGKNVDEAEKVLADAQLKARRHIVLKQATENSSSRIDVLDQAPAAGVLIAPGAEVELKLLELFARAYIPVRVPQVAHMDQADAERLLVERGLRPRARLVLQRSDVGDRPGERFEVISPKPREGTEVPPNSEVELSVMHVVTTSRQLIEIPPVKHRPVDEAEDELRKDGFTNIARRLLLRRLDTSGKKQATRTEVIRQDPVAGTKVPVETPITLNYLEIVSASSNEFAMPELPRDYNAALAILVEKGLGHNDNVVARKSETGDTFEVRREITDHSPKAGEMIKPGDHVNLSLIEIKRTIAHGALMPDLIGMDADEARAKLRERQLQWREDRSVITVFGPAASVRYEITGQVPTKGTPVRKRASVKIVVREIQTVVAPEANVPPKKVTVPELSSNYETALSQLDEAGLKGEKSNPVEIRELVADEASDRLVVNGSEPSPGAIVDVCSMVILKVVHVKARPRMTVEVPQLEGKTWDFARQELERAGLGCTPPQPQVVYRRVIASHAGRAPETRVSWQSPEAGEKVTPGSSVQVHLKMYVFQPPKPAQPQSAIAVECHSRNTTSLGYRTNAGPGATLDTYLFESSEHDSLLARFALMPGVEEVQVDGQAYLTFVGKSTRRPNPQYPIENWVIRFPKSGNGIVYGSTDRGASFRQDLTDAIQRVK